MVESTATVNLKAEPGETREQTEAKFATSPQLAGAVVQREFCITSKESTDLTALTTLLTETCREIVDGSSDRSLRILTAQAEALNAIFVKLATQAALNMGDYIGATEAYMRMALRAQSQSRATLEAISRIQNPKLASFVGQLNATTGPQRVNNGISEVETAPNELLESCDDQRMDFGTAAATITSNSKVEALEPVYRSSLL